METIQQNVWADRAWADGASAPPAVPADTRVYAIGDIHGRLDLLERIHERITADAAGKPGGTTPADGRRVVVYLGDYVDRGPDSAGVLETLAAAPLPGMEAVHLKGNHEDLMIRFLDGDPFGAAWLFNGGLQTLHSYGLGRLDHPYDADGLAAAREALAAAVPEHHRAFLRRLRPVHDEGDFLFAHAGVRPGVALTAQEEPDLMWIRGEFLDSRRRFGKVVVHGHSIEPLPVVRPNRIGIDTGACYTGRLTGLVLDGDRQYFLHT